tara:strand:+ start:1180 stop:1461 length:282 start_codon:yes stop_codon:yes gene_type:complete
MFTPLPVEALIEPLPPLREPVLLFALGAFFLRAPLIPIGCLATGASTALAAGAGATFGGGGGEGGSSGGSGAGLGADELRLGAEHIIFNPHYL